MSIAPTLQRYLTAENIQYDVIPHDPTMSSARTAEACRISGDRLAKAIVLRRNAGYVLAVLPASHHLRLSDLRDQLGDNVEMAKESEIDPLFPDCVRGCSAPRSLLRAASHRGRQHRGAAGDRYGVGRSRDAAPYKSCAARLMGNARHGRFSEKLPHSMSSSIVWG
jgi:Ala-tRNA(Pro) deacylase